jgi:hypothetical protein
VSSTHRIPTFQNYRVKWARFSKSSSPKFFQTLLQIQSHEEEEEEEEEEEATTTTIKTPHLLKSKFIFLISFNKKEQKGGFPFYFFELLQVHVIPSTTSKIETHTHKNLP